MKLSTLAIVSAAALASVTSIASAIPSFGSASPTKANAGTDFIPGNGISETGFTIDTALTGESVALKARNRAFPGEPVLQLGNRYIVAAGMDTPTRAAFQFEFQFSPGVGGNQNPAAYTYELRADIDPSFGVANFVTLSVPSSVVAGPLGDSYYPNGTGGSISAGPTYSYNGPWSDATPFVIANSQNYSFGHFAGAGFTNPGGAEYEIQFTARNAAGAIVASTNIFAVTVPEPTTLAAVAGAGIVGLRRRRQA